MAGMRSTDTISRGGDAVSGLAALLFLISVCVAVVGPNLISSSDMRSRRTCTFCCVIYLAGAVKNIMYPPQSSAAALHPMQPPPCSRREPLPKSVYSPPLSMAISFH